MAGPDLVVRVAANISALQADMTKAAASIKTIETAATGASATTSTAFQRMGEATTTATIPTDRLRHSISQFDGVLASLGVNISAETRALGELAEASGKTASQIGLIATAGLVVGAGMAGWKIGRAVADFFDLDTAIASATARWLGYGDVVAQTAGAKQDTINRAIKDGAAATISYSDAVAFNTQRLGENRALLTQRDAVLKQHAAELAKIAVEEAKWAAIMAELDSAGGTWRETLNGINGEVVEAVQFYLQAGVSQGTLATAYALTATQIKAVASALADELAAAKTLAEFRVVADARQKEIMAAMLAATNAQVVAELAAAQEKKRSEEAFLAGALAEAVAQDKVNASLGQVPAIAAAVTASVQGIAQSYWAAVDAAAALSGVTVVGHRPGEGPGINGAKPASGGSFSFQPGGATDPRVLGYLSQGYSIGEAQALVGGYGASIGAPTRRAMGGPVAAGQPYTVGERGPELFVPSAAGSIVPNGGGFSITNIYITQPLGTPAAIAQLIDQALMTRQRSQGARFPVGVA